jgi:hypothetical protein
MSMGGAMPDEEKPIGELFGQLIDDGKAFAQAEVALVKAQAASKAGAYKRPAALLVVAALFVIAAVVMLIITIAAGLATLIGPLAGGLAATVLAVLIAGGLALAAKKDIEKLK